jgi:hypothetical protein
VRAASLLLYHPFVHIWRYLTNFGSYISDVRWAITKLTILWQIVATSLIAELDYISIDSVLDKIDGHSQTVDVSNLLNADIGWISVRTVLDKKSLRSPLPTVATIDACFRGFICLLRLYHQWMLCLALDSSKFLTSRQLVERILLRPIAHRRMDF